MEILWSILCECSLMASPRRTTPAGTIHRTWYQEGTNVKMALITSKSGFKETVFLEDHFAMIRKEQELKATAEKQLSE